MANKSKINWLKVIIIINIVVVAKFEINSNYYNFNFVYC